MALIYKSLLKKAYCLFSLSMRYQRSIRFCVPRMLMLRWYEMSPRDNKPTLLYKAPCWTRYAWRPTSLFSNFARRTVLVVKQKRTSDSFKVETSYTYYARENDSHNRTTQCKVILWKVINYLNQAISSPLSFSCWNWILKFQNTTISNKLKFGICCSRIL